MNDANATDIIIPVWNQSALTVQCLRSIRAHTPEPYRVVLVDNASEPAEFAVVEEELRLHESVLLIRNTENVGFVRATNRGLAAAEAPFVVLMNNDTEAVAGWLGKLMEPMKDARVGAVGPLTTTPLSWQGRYARSPGWRIINTTAMLAFFCTLLRREMVEQVGLLDEDFGVGFGDDDDYCGRIHEAGWRLALATDLVIPHHHRTSFKARFAEEEILAMQGKAMALFRRKKEERAKARSQPKDLPRRGPSADDIHEAFRWIARTVRDARTQGAPVGLVLEPDPWSLATLALLGDMGEYLADVIVFTSGGKPGGRATLPGRVEVASAAADRLVREAIAHLKVPGVRFLDVPEGASAAQVLAEYEDLPGTLLLGRWMDPEPVPTRRAAELGRVYASFTHGIDEGVIGRFLVGRGVPIPPGYAQRRRA